MQNIASFAPLFIAIVESGSFTKAARTLNVSKSFLSEQTKLIEKELGVTLLLRTTRNLSLTDAGQRYLEQCKKLASWKTETSELVSSSKTDITGKLSVTCVQAFAEFHMHDVIQNFTQEYPQVKVRLIANNLHSNLLSEDFDLAIRLTENPPEHMVAKKIMDVSYICCTSPKYFETIHQPNNPGDLLNYNCAITPETHNWVFSNDKEEIKQPISGNVVTSSNHIFRELALTGTHIICVPAYVVSHEIKEGSLIRVLGNWTPHTRSLYLIYPQQKQLPLKVRKFIQHLETRAKDIINVQNTLFTRAYI